MCGSAVCSEMEDTVYSISHHIFIVYTLIIDIEFCRSSVWAGQAKLYLPKAAFESPGVARQLVGVSHAAGLDDDAVLLASVACFGIGRRSSSALISSHIRVAARRPAVGVSSGQQRERALPIVLYARHARGDFERIGSTRTVHSRPRTRRRKDLVLIGRGPAGTGPAGERNGCRALSGGSGD